MKPAPSATSRYFLAENGEAVGPFTVEQLRAMFASGRVHAGSQVCPEGGSAWVSAAALDLQGDGKSQVRLNQLDRTGLGMCFAGIGMFLCGALLRVEVLMAAAFAVFAVGLIVAAVGRWRAER